MLNIGCMEKNKWKIAVIILLCITDLFKVMGLLTDEKAASAILPGYWDF